MCIIALFALSRPRVCYLGAASLLSGSYVLIRNIRFTKKLLPEIRIAKEHFDLQAVRELIASGIWNTLTHVGKVLMDGLDLLITNIFINATSMGVLSLAKTLPSLITGLMGTVVNVFSPNFTILYAENRHEELFASVRQSMKIMGLITNLPIIVLIVCGQEFFRLWQPTQDAQALQILGLLSIGVLFFSGGINCLYNIFTVVNKIRVNSLVVLGTSFFGAVCTLILLKTTSLGVYAVAGTSTAVALFRNLLFTAPYGAKCLNRKWYVFYPDIFRPALFAVASSLVCMALLRFTAQGWIILACKACFTCAISGAIGFFVILNQNDRNYLLGILKRIIRKH
jgi:O-antigen/teichoic acid export membrane protein